MKRTIVPYNPHVKELAKKLRRNMRFSEVKLWNEIKNGQMMDYDFDRQRPIGSYIVDFYCKDLKLALEIVVNKKVEVRVREIKKWITEYEDKHGANEFVKKRRDVLLIQNQEKESSPPYPSREGTRAMRKVL
jgi:hypothetical protein